MKTRATLVIIGVLAGALALPLGRPAAAQSMSAAQVCDARGRLAAWAATLRDRRVPSYQVVDAVQQRLPGRDVETATRIVLDVYADAFSTPFQVQYWVVQNCMQTMRTQK